MTAQIIDGRKVAARIQDGIREEVTAFEAEQGFVPGLAVLLVGDDPASAMYVRMKGRRCESVGMKSFTNIMPADSTQEDVLAAVRAYNDNPDVHGILVQLPLPDHIDEETILKEVSLAKDVDGFHPINIGALAMKGRTPTFTPATPTGCMTLIAESGLDVSGKKVTIVPVKSVSPIVFTGYKVFPLEYSCCQTFPSL